MPIRTSYEDLKPTTAPAGVEGRFYYDSTEKVLKFFNGSEWVAGGVTEPEGYDGFDNNGGGTWTHYINIPVTTIPSEYAQYKIVIQSDSIEVFSADGTSQVSGSGIADFWSRVKTDGSDIRLFDQARNQLYFWMESFDYSEQSATIWVSLTAGSTELNIAYGNPSATKSAYDDPNMVFEFFDDFEQDTVGGTPLKWVVNEDAGEIRVSDTYAYSGGKSLKVTDTGTQSGRHYAYVELPSSVQNGLVVEVAVKLLTNNYHRFSVDDSTIETGAKTPCPATIGFGSNSLEFNYVSDGDGWIAVESLDTEWHVYTMVVDLNNYIKILKDGVVKVENQPLYSTPDYWKYSQIFVSGGTFSGSEGYYDNVKIMKLADPADFGTPQITTF